MTRQPERAAVPSRLPVLPGLHLDAEYATRRPAITGRSWFDVLGLADGRAAMLVGDVMEQDIPGADVAGRFRPLLAQLVAESREVIPALEALNHRLRKLDLRHTTSVCLAIIDPVDGQIDYSTCGHSPPLIINPVHGARPLPQTGGGPLGLDLPVVAGTQRLGQDDVLMLCTGISSRSQETLTDRLTDLARAGDVFADRPTEAGNRSHTAAVCRTATEAIRPTDRRNGLAVLAAQRRAPVRALELSIPAIGANLAGVRDAVGDWLADLRSSVEDGAGMSLAVGEATANAIQHAFVGRAVGTVGIEARLLSDGELACWVRDDGRWLTPESSMPGTNGRGLHVMARSCDRVKVSRGAGGTVVELRRRLHHPVTRSGASA